MSKAIGWFKNLKKWQKGGLIGGAIGLLLAVIIILSPYRLQRQIENFHEICYALPTGIALFGWDEHSTGKDIIEYGGAASIVIFYGVLGMLAGIIQQIANLSQKWLLTALLALFLLLFYVMNYYGILF